LESIPPQLSIEAAVLLLPPPPPSVADPDPGSGIGCLFDPWILDPGWEKVSIRIRVRDEQPGSYFLELRNHFLLFLGLKNLNSFMRIRDPGWRQFGSGIRIEKSRIRDKHPGSATLVKIVRKTLIILIINYL
jgi:hypothetical protein